VEIKKEFNIYKDNKDIQKPEYESPEIITYTEDEIIEQIGPAQACSPSPCITTL